MAAAGAGSPLEVTKECAAFTSALQPWAATKPPMAFNEWPSGFAKIHSFCKGRRTTVPTVGADYTAICSAMRHQVMLDVHCANWKALLAPKRKRPAKDAAGSVHPCAKVPEAPHPFGAIQALLEGMFEGSPLGAIQDPMLEKTRKTMLAPTSEGPTAFPINLRSGPGLQRDAWGSGASHHVSRLAMREGAAV